MLTTLAMLFTCGEPDEVVAGEVVERDVPNQGHPVYLRLLCGLHDHVTSNIVQLWQVNGSRKDFVGD